MKIKLLCSSLLILTIVLESTGIVLSAQGEPGLPISGFSAETELDKELKIYRSTLFENKNEQLRIDAAGVMLFKEEPAARKILIDALRQSENKEARAAVCKALSQARGAWRPIKNKEDFIQPLLDILTEEEDSTTAKLAADATLIFSYDQISEQLNEIITDTSLPAVARLNAVYALELHPDMRVAIKLIMLLDDPEKQVSEAAEKTLRSLGVQPGKDPAARKKTIAELERQGSEAFLRNLLIREESRVREMTIEMNLWQGLYLAALGKIYDGLGDEAAKGKFLAEHLSNPHPIVKLWALEKAYQWRVRPGSRLPAELKLILINLIPDQNKDVRLRTANLLSLIGEISSAQPLLAQLDIEQDDEARMELLVALGGACYSASLPDSPVKLPLEIRQQTLEWAAKYLSDQEPKRAQKGAEVMRKLLELEGLAPAEVDKYLTLLAERCGLLKGKAEGPLLGELLNVMAGLCAPSSACRVKASRLFGPLFEQSLYDSADLVREAAVDGLLNTDKTKALNRLRKDFANDPSVAVRKKLIALAGEVGGKEDLVWLAEKIGSNTESDAAWQAMLKIFNGADITVLSEWMGKCASESSPIKLSDEQRTSFLEVAEQKATAEKKTDMLREVRYRLARLHSKNGIFERAADYWRGLYETAQTAREKEAILPDLLDAYLRWPNLSLAVKIVENCLLEKDLAPDNIIVQTIEYYMSNPPAGSDPNVVWRALEQAKTSKGRPMWQQQLKMWANRLAKTEEADKPEGSNGLN